MVIGNRGFYFMRCLLALGVFCAHSILAYAQADKIIVLTTQFEEPSLIDSPLQLAARFIKSSAFESRFKRDGHASLMWQEFYAQPYALAKRYQSILLSALKKGYRIEVLTQSKIADFLHALENPATVAILHEGHGVSDTARPEIVALEFNTEILAKKAFESFLNEHSKTKITATPNLRFIYTSGCRAAHCPSYYREWLEFPQDRWVAALESPTARNMNSVQEDPIFIALLANLKNKVDALESLPLPGGFAGLQKRLSLRFNCASNLSVKD